jgi:hypothetical protein
LRSWLKAWGLNVVQVEGLVSSNIKDLVANTSNEVRGENMEDKAVVAVAGSFENEEEEEEEDPDSPAAKRKRWISILRTNLKIIITVGQGHDGIVNMALPWLIALLGEQQFFQIVCGFPDVLSIPFPPRFEGFLSSFNFINLVGLHTSTSRLPFAEGLRLLMSSPGLFLGAARGVRISQQLPQRAGK